jgi:beta-lactamase regulating signal transducer with metallopeptidase domain
MMTAINEMLQQPLSQAIGWALLQFVWQGTSIAVVTAAVLAALRRSGPDVRYVVSTIALALMLTTPVVTVVQTLAAAAPAVTMAAASSSMPSAAHEDTRVGAAVAAIAAAASSSVEAPRSFAAPAFARRSLGEGGAWSVDEWLPLFVSLWLAGVLVLTLRLLSGWICVQRMKSHGAHPAPEALQAAAERLMRRLHIGGAVRVLESTSVAVPTVIGWLKPVVLLPASALAGLAPGQLEAILAHELAHVRRHDYIVNLFQTVVETLLFYHPAVWWLSRRIRAERENCCDDLAVSLCGDPVAYAAALAELEGLRSTPGSVVLAASGGSLLERVRRLLGVPTHAGRAPGWLAAGAALLVLIGMSASALARGPFVDQQVPVAVPPVPPSGPESPRPVVAVPVEAAAVPIAATPAALPTGVVASPAVAPPAVVATTPLEAIPAAMVGTPQTPAPPVVMATPVVPSFEQTSPAPVFASTPAVPVAALPSATPISAPTAPAVAATAPAMPTMVAPAPRVPAAMPVVAVPQTASTQTSSSSTSSATSRSDSQSSGNWVWSDNGRKVEVTYRGDIEFTDDDMDVKRLSPGGYLRIKDGGRFGTSNSIEFRAGSGGAIERRFWVSGREQPFEPEGRKWTSEVLPTFIRQSGIGAAARVTRIMKSGGASAVLAEISRIEGSFVRRVYFTELLKQPGLSSANIQQALTQAGREIDSDFELASLLISSNRLVTDDAARRAYLDAARTIESDFELRRVLGSIVKAGPMNPAVAAGVLDVSSFIASDFEQASLLAEFAANHQIDGAVTAPYFKALSGVSSSFEHHRALTALMKRGDLSAAARSAALESAATIESDFELASFLLEFLKTGGVEKGERAPFFRAVSSISSDFERGRVLQALARHSDASDETVLEILRSIQTMNGGDFERARVLIAVASSQPLSRAGRDAYIDAAEKLSNFEQGRALSALVKNERRQ